MKKKSLVYLVMIALFVMGVTGCGAAVSTASTQEVAEQQEQSTQEATTEQVSETTQESFAESAEETSAITFTDDLGREVTVNQPQRVATLLGSYTDLWLLAGGEVVAAANDSWTSFDLNLSDTVVNIGSHASPDAEKIIAANPDFVIASSNTKGNVELEDVLTQAGITVAYFEVTNFEEYMNMFRICTQITGREDLYQQYGVEQQEEINTILARVDGRKPTVLFMRASSDNVKARGSEGIVGGEILADLDCVNIADQDESLLDDLSMEAIIAADPEYIFVTTQGTDTEQALSMVTELLENNPAWSTLSAVKNGNYYVLDKRLYNSKPNARWTEAYEQLADILYAK